MKSKAPSATGRRQVVCAAESRRSPIFAQGNKTSKSFARVCVLGGDHAVSILRGFELPLLYASPPRALMAGLLPDANAGEVG